jgi:cell division GTPase FtsZ
VEEETTNGGFESFAHIKVVGVGGSGNSAINRMISAKTARHRIHCRQHRCAGSLL